MVRHGLVTSAVGVEEFLANQFRWSVLPADGVALLNAYQATAASDLDPIMSIDRLLLALKLPQEMRTASTQLGQRLITETTSFVANSIHAKYRDRVIRRETPGNGAIAVGITAWALGIPDHQALLLFCHSHAVSVLGAALRLLPLTHSDAQLILHNLHPVVTQLSQEIAGTDWRDMTSFVPELDIVSMNHEADDLRLFAS
jgi:urease accessory protein